MPERTKFEFQYTQPQTLQAHRRKQDGPMRILVMADLTGRVNRGVVETGTALAERPIVHVDVDNFDDVLFRFSPRLELLLDGSETTGVSLEMKRMEDFHPDALYRDVDLFKAFRKMRKRMLDPSTSAEELTELQRSWGAAARTDTDQEEESATPAKDDHESDANTLERLLGRQPVDRPQARARPSAARVDVSELVRRLIEPHIVPASVGSGAHLVKGIDEATSEQMRSLLRSPAFQALEGTWRGIDDLLSNVETGEELKVFVLDVSKQELAADLGTGQRDLSDSGLYRLLVENTVKTLGGQPWSVLVGDYRFGPTAEDVSILSIMGAIASHAGGPFLAASDHGLFEAAADRDELQRWSGLRSEAAASWLGLAAPGVLLRLPYGANTESVESFEFEELTHPGQHEAYLWGNPAYLCARLLAVAFEQRGWSMQPGDVLEIDDLPGYVYLDGGEKKLKPCAELLLNERAAAEILDRGIMPVLSYVNRNAVRLMRYQSISDPPTALSGPWG